VIVPLLIEVELGSVALSKKTGASFSGIVAVNFIRSWKCLFLFDHVFRSNI